MRYMMLRGKVWWTNFGHPALGLRPNGRDNLLRVTTGIKESEQAKAGELSDAFAIFKADPIWLDPAKYREAREIHEQAAQIFYSPYKKKEKHYVLAKNFKPNERYLTTKAGRDKEQEISDLKVREAENEALIQSLKKQLGQALTGADVKFEELKTQYMEWGKSRWSANHYERRKQQIEWWATKFPSIGKINIASVEAFQRELKSSRSTKTVEHYTDALRGMLQYAVDRNILLNHPLQKLAALEGKDAKDYRPLTMEEFGLLMTHCAPQRALIYGLAFVTGLRAKELRSLLVSDFNVVRQELRVRWRTTKANKRDSIKAIPAEFCSRLAESVIGKAPTDRLLPTSPDGNGAAKLFRLDCEKAGIDTKEMPEGKLVFHSLRVTHATYGMEAGSARTVQTSMRHSNLAMTSRYARAVPEGEKKMVEALWGMVGS